MNLENWTRLRPLPLPLWRLRWLWSQSVLSILLCTTVLLFKLIPTSSGSILNGSSTIHMRTHTLGGGVNFNAHHGPSAESESDGIHGFDPGRPGRQIGPQIEIKDSTWAEILQAANTSPFDWTSFSRVMSQAITELQLEKLHTLHSNAHWAFEFHRIRRKETEDTDPPYMGRVGTNQQRRVKGIVAVSIVPNKVPPPLSMTTTSVRQKRARRFRGTRRSRRRNWIEEILSASAVASKQ